MDNAKLMKMLSGAKQVMDKVDSSNFKVDHNKLNERVSNVNSDGLLESLPNGVTPTQTPRQTPTNNSVDSIMNSRLPESVKNLMINNPIPKMQMESGGGPTFNLEDVKGLVNPSQQYTQQHTQQPRQQIEESAIVNSEGKRLIMMTEAELDKKIKDALLSFMATTFTKNITENTIKTTINTLIKEGKIRVKPKTNTK